MCCKDIALIPEASGTGSQNPDGHTPHSASVAFIGTDHATPEDRDALSAQNPPTGGQLRDVAVPSKELLFRCKLCKRLAHYAHLPPPDGVFEGTVEEVNIEAIAEYYQHNQDWSCADCVSFVYRAEKILAWRPDPINAQQPELPDGESINPKMHLPREYLVKWQDRGYRRVQWVPHGWLASVQAGLLRHFLLHGSKVQLLEHAVREDQVANAVSEGGIGGSNKESDEPQSNVAARSEGLELLPSLDAERRVPPAWKTVDRVLDVLIWVPHEQKPNGKKRRNDSETTASVDGTANPEVQREWNDAFEFGEVPSAQNTRTLEEWEAQGKNELSFGDIDRVVWAFIKWDDLGYDEGKYYCPLVWFHHLIEG
jgi:hypothetical protein